MRASPWDIDLPTIWWIIWIGWFLVGEYIGYLYGGEMFTHHVWWVRNWAAKENATIIIFLLLAILLWVNFHFIREGWRYFS